MTNQSGDEMNKQAATVTMKIATVINGALDGMRKAYRAGYIDQEQFHILYKALREDGPTEKMWREIERLVGEEAAANAKSEWLIDPYLGPREELR